VDFIVTDSSRIETAFLEDFEMLDVDIGKQNDFELRIPRSTSKKLAIELGGFLFCPKTEFGGVITRIALETTDNSALWSGIAWRGLLSLDIIIPPLGQDYRVISGEANNILRTVLAENGSVGIFFDIPYIDTGVTFTNYQFHRYETKLKGLSRMLLSKGLKLRIRAVQGGSNEPFKVTCEAVPIIDYSNKLEYSDDYKMNISIVQDDGGINHIICLGRGELKDREVVHLYVQSGGAIGTTKYYTGFDERVAVYNYSSVESLEELVKGGIEKLQELKSSKRLDLKVADLDFGVEIGDIVGGRDRVENIYLTKPVTGLIYRSTGGVEEIEASVSENESIDEIIE